MSFGLIARPHVPVSVFSATAMLAGSSPNHAATIQPREAAVFTASPAVIDLDFGSAVSVTLAALIGCEASGWRLQGAASQTGLGAAPDVVNTAVPAPGWRGVSALHYQASAAAFRQLTGAANLSLGRLVLSDAFAPTHSFDLGRNAARAPGLAFDEAAGGALYPLTRIQRRQWAVSFGHITDAEYSATIDALDDYAGSGGEVVFAANATLAPGAREQAALYGLMALAAGAAREHVNRWRAPVTLHELV